MAYWKSENTGNSSSEVKQTFSKKKLGGKRSNPRIARKSRMRRETASASPDIEKKLTAEAPFNIDSMVCLPGATQKFLTLVGGGQRFLALGIESHLSL